MFSSLCATEYDGANKTWYALAYYSHSFKIVWYMRAWFNTRSSHINKFHTYSRDDSYLICPTAFDYMNTHQFESYEQSDRTFFFFFWFSESCSRCNSLRRKQHSYQNPKKTDKKKKGKRKQKSQKINLKFICKIVQILWLKFNTVEIQYNLFEKKIHVYIWRRYLECGDDLVF